MRVNNVFSIILEVHKAQTYLMSNNVKIRQKNLKAL